MQMNMESNAMSDDTNDKVIKDSEIIGSSDYIWLILRIAVMAIPVAVLTLIYLALYKGGTILVWETLPDSLNISRPAFTVLVATLGGLLVGLGLRYLGVRHGESLQTEMEAGRVPYRGILGLMVTALVGLISGASLGPEGPLGHMGASFGSWVSVRLNLSLEKSRLMTLAGVSAAFGGFLVQPFSGAFMSMEFTGSLTHPIYTNMIAAIVSSLIGALVVFNLATILPSLALPFPAYEGFHWLHLLYAVMFGLLGLGMAFLFKIIFQYVTRLVKPLDRNPAAQTDGWRVDFWAGRRLASAHTAFRRGRAAHHPGAGGTDRYRDAGAAGVFQALHPEHLPEQRVSGRLCLPAFVFRRIVGVCHPSALSVHSP